MFIILCTMPDTVTQLYLKALKLVNLSRLSEATGRAYRTLQAYRRKERRVTDAAVRELAQYLRAHASSLTKAADQLEAALHEEEKNE